MNCQYFEEIINDLAREQLMDAAARTGAADHASVCARCSARLADERMLSAGLRRLAASAKPEEAPARVESQLLAAFRERQVAAPLAVAHLATARSARRWPRLVAAAAAAIFIIVALAAIRFNQPRLLEAVKQAKGLTINAQLGAPALAPPNERERAVAINQVSINQIAINDQPRLSQKEPRRNTNHRKESSNASSKNPDASSEIATDFIPLMHDNGLDSMESGQMVRVELPRSALVSFGLPMNMEMADERIKADVVIGNDGLARAIRFVR